VIVHDGEPRALDREEPNQLLEPILDPQLAMLVLITAQ
jgi:hypothetical protein